MTRGRTLRAVLPAVTCGLAIAACSAPASTPVSPTAASLDLQWSMTLDGERVRIDYTVRNQTSERIVLLDRLRDVNGPSDLAVVRASDRPTTIAVTRAYVPSGDKLDLRPITRALPAHAVASGTAYVAWPLRAQHNTATPTVELPSGIDGVLLEIGYVDGASTLETIDGAEVPDANTLRAQKLLRSAVRSIPEPAALPPVDASPVDVTWAPTREGARVRIDYTIRNRGEAPVILCDRMRSTKGPTDLAVVQPSGSAGIVKLTRAFVPPVPQVIVEKQPRPIAHVLAPNETATGIAYVELPIRPYHPIYDPPYTLPPRFDYAVFEIGYVDAALPLETETMERQSYEVPQRAALHAQKLVRGDVQRLP